MKIEHYCVHNDMGSEEHWISDEFLDMIINYYDATPKAVEKLFNDMGTKTGATWFADYNKSGNCGFAVVFRDFQVGNRHMLMMDIYENSSHYVHAFWEEFMDEFRSAYKAWATRYCPCISEKPGAVNIDLSGLTQVRQDVEDLKAQLQKLQKRIESGKKTKR